MAHNPYRILVILALMILFVLFFNPGCQAGHWKYQGRILGLGQSAHWQAGQDPRYALHLSPAAEDFHHTIMEDHMDAVHDLVQLLGRRNYTQTKTLTQTRLGFAIHHRVMTQQRSEDFPQEYHTLAMAHHQAAEDMAQVIDSHNPQEIGRSHKKLEGLWRR